MASVNIILCSESISVGQGINEYRVIKGQFYKKL